MKFENIIESADPQLEGFFKYMINLVIPKERSAHSINEAKKSVVGLCYDSRLMKQICQST